MGLVLRGKYHLDRVLGVGGMGAVYAATHRNRKRFALKMLHPELSCMEGIRTRFLREGYVANSVNHPGAVAVLDDDVAEDGSAFLVMELLEGKSFETLWEDRGRVLPTETLIALFDQVLDVLGAAHAQGIVHRDLKPANLFLTHTGVVKVLDFGIARLLDTAGGGALTQTGTTLGTPAFMAPEQARGSSAELDAQTDLWAVGATMFVLISGRFVHEGDNPHQLLMSAAMSPAPTLRSVEPLAHQAVAAVVDRALAFDKGARWADAAEMRRALMRAGSDAFGKDFESIASMTAASFAETAMMQRWAPGASAELVTGGTPQAASHERSVLPPEASVPPSAFGAREASVPPREPSVAPSAALSREPSVAPSAAVSREPSAAIPGVASPTGPSLAAPSPIAKYAVGGLVLGLTIAVVLLATRRETETRANGSVASETARAEPAPSGLPLPAPSSGKSETLDGAVVNPTPSSARHTPGNVPTNTRPSSPASPPPAFCARLLERQSLGETLTAAERAAFAQHCQK